MKKHLEKKTDEIDARDVNSILISEPEGEPPIYVRVGRYGPFIEQGDRRASLPDGIAPEELTLEKCRELFQQASQADEPLGVCPDTGKPMYLKVGRFGPYVQRGTPDDEEKPQNASLLKGMTPEEVDLAMALKLLSLPRDLGKHPGKWRDHYRFQRPLWTVREVRRGNSLAAGRSFAAGCDFRASDRTAEATQSRSGADSARSVNR